MNSRFEVLEAVRRDGLALLRASSVLQDDREIVMAAVEQNGMALVYASERLQGDRGIVMAAVNCRGMALQYASDDLKNDPHVVASAITCEHSPCRDWTHRDICGQQLKALITGTLIALKEHGVEDPSDHTDFADTATIVKYAQQWKKELCERIWLLTEQGPKPLPNEVKTDILGLAGVQGEYLSACDLIQCAPVIAADMNLESPRTLELLQEEQARKRRRLA